MCQEGNKNTCNEQFYCSTKIIFVCNKYSTIFWRCMKCTLQFWRTITCRQPFCLQTDITGYEVTYCKITKHPIQSNSFTIMPCMMFSKTKCYNNLVPNFSHITDVQFTFPASLGFNPIWAYFIFSIKVYHNSNFQLTAI